MRAKSAQGVPYCPWPGLTASAGLLISAEIRTRWCQLRVSSTGWRFANSPSPSRSQVVARTASVEAHLPWDKPSVSVCWRPPLSVALVTHLVTRLFAAFVGVTCSDEPQLQVMRSYRFALKPTLSCYFASQQFSSLHVMSGAHVPWMCPASMGQSSRLRLIPFASSSISRASPSQPGNEK